LRRGRMHHAVDARGAFEAHHELAREALTIAQRTDLIGLGAGCLVPPAPRMGRPAPASTRPRRAPADSPRAAYALRPSRSVPPHPGS
jgi:hypothetical protein